LCGPGPNVPLGLRFGHDKLHESPVRLAVVNAPHARAGRPSFFDVLPITVPAQDLRDTSFGAVDARAHFLSRLARVVIAAPIWVNAVDAEPVVVRAVEDVDSAVWPLCVEAPPVHARGLAWHKVFNGASVRPLYAVATRRGRASVKVHFHAVGCLGTDAPPLVARPCVNVHPAIWLFDAERAVGHLKAARGRDCVNICAAGIVRWSTFFFICAHWFTNATLSTTRTQKLQMFTNAHSGTAQSVCGTWGTPRGSCRRHTWSRRRGACTAGTWCPCGCPCR